MVSCPKKPVWLGLGAPFIKNLKIIGGCPGNTVGVSRLVVGRSVDEVIEMLKGIECGARGTSCPDQVAIALEEYKKDALK